MRESMNVARRGRGLTVLLVAVGLLVGGIYVTLTSPAKPGAASFQATSTPEASSGEALRQLRAMEEANLTTYGWADRKNGIVHIPIDRAIDLILQRGLPTRPQETPQPNEVF